MLVALLETRCKQMISRVAAVHRASQRSHRSRSHTELWR
jgi:hypothetical protein